MKKILKKIPIFYPTLFILYPILHLYSVNIEKVEFAEVAFIMAIILIAGILLFGLLKILFRNDKKTALASTILIILFFLYLPIYNHIAGLKIGILDQPGTYWIMDWTFGRHRYLILFFGLVLLSSLWWIKKTTNSLDDHTKILNFIAIILIIFPLPLIVNYEYQISIKKSFSITNDNFTVQKNQRLSYKPDVYYIILDAHAREDILTNSYDYKDPSFFDGLKKRGFCIADKSYSNYGRTLLSLSSSLNMQYLDNLTKQYGKNWNNEAPLFNLIQKNKVQEFFKKQGYYNIALASGYGGTETMRSEVNSFISYKDSIGEFTNEFINITPISFFASDVPSISPYRIHRDRILFNFEKIKGIPDIKDPTYTFVHIVSPHSPFVFDKTGSEIVQDQPFTLNPDDLFSTGNYIERYVEQTAFIDQKVIEVIDSIIKESKNPPIIIVQSDHGPGDLGSYTDKKFDYKKVRSAILNAYYLPSFNCEKLDKGISPVNSFRFIFNYYFGTNYKILKNRTYSTRYKTTFDFQEITVQIKD